uniref:Uncharacterized protein n=1 Tax=Knipowitschia caucasica TaxID=637954 RepID=A0AAV2MMW6_KNICA
MAELISAPAAARARGRLRARTGPASIDALSGAVNQRGEPEAAAAAVRRCVAVDKGGTFFSATPAAPRTLHLHPNVLERGALALITAARCFTALPARL